MEAGHPTRYRILNWVKKNRKLNLILSKSIFSFVAGALPSHFSFYLWLFVWIGTHIDSLFLFQKVVCYSLVSGFFLVWFGRTNTVCVGLTLEINLWNNFFLFCVLQSKWYFAVVIVTVNVVYAFLWAVLLDLIGIRLDGVRSAAESESIQWIISLSE